METEIEKSRGVRGGELRVPIRVAFEHRVYFTRDVFAPENDLWERVITAETPGQPARILVVVDGNLAKAFPELIGRITHRLAGGSTALVRAPMLVPGGEPAKNTEGLVEELADAMRVGGLSRHSYVIGVGGGAVLDAVGYAAAIVHRGIRHIRVPTTTLSQADGGVGIKNGVNAFGVKNFLGTFAVPHAVINDFDFLKGLPRAERRSGFAEAVKVALIRDRVFFEWLDAEAERLARFEEDVVEEAVRRCAELHLRHIATSGDPFELGSARPLDFGHWAAHKLEAMSGFRIGHGEGVAIGLAIDTIYSVRARYMGRPEGDRVLDVLRRLGFPLDADELERVDELLGGLEDFREHLGGELTITLLSGIGRGFEVHAIDTELVRASISELRGA